LKIIKKEFDKGKNRNFIKFIYKNYPPKNNHTCPDDIESLLSEEIKKVGKNALIDYHEDKNSAAKFGFEW
jgi:hypothetical protein